MFRNILVPIDLRTERSWRKSPPLAAGRARHYGATLTLLCVVPDVWHVEAEPRENDETVARLRGNAGDIVDEDTKHEIRVEHHNSARRCIREVAGREGADLIAMTSHDPGPRDPHLGSTATQGVHHADCSMPVVR